MMAQINRNHELTYRINLIWWEDNAVKGRVGLEVGSRVMIEGNRYSGRDVVLEHGMHETLTVVVHMTKIKIKYNTITLKST